MRRSLLTFGTALAAMLLLLVGAWGIGASLAAVGTVPANDNFADAEVLTTQSGSVTGSNTAATAESGEDYCYATQPPMNTVWYVFTPEADGGVVVEITTADFDTVMGIYTGAGVAATTRVADSNDTGDSTLSRVDFAVTGGTAYYIQVDGISEEQGDFVLEWAYLAAPANDALADAAELSGANGTLVHQHNYAATAETGESEISGALESVWYFFTAPSDGVLNVQTTDPDYFVLAGYTGASPASYDALTHIATDVATINIDVEQGETYWIQCDGDGEWQSVFTINWSFNVSPSNDDFEDAAVLVGESGSVAGTTVAAGEEPGEPVGYDLTPLDTVWYYWVAPADGRATFTMTPEDDTDYYMGMTLYDGGPGLADLQYVYDGSDSMTSTVREGTTYWIQVDGYSDYQGSFTLGWSFTYPPGNDDFADATILTEASGTVEGRNTAATLETDELLPAEYNEASVWYVWTAPSNGLMELTMTDPDPTYLDTGLAVYTGSGLGSLTRVAFANEGGTGSLSAVSFAARGGTTYHIQIVGYYLDQQGTFTLGWSFTAGAAEAPVITSDDHADFMAGEPGTFTIDCTGSPAPSIYTDWSAVYVGVSFVDNGDGTATLSGTPAIDKGGQYFLTIYAHNTYGSTQQSFTLTVNEKAEVRSQTWGPLSKEAGSELTLYVTPRGYPAPTAQWQLSTDGGESWADIAGATSSTYTVDLVTTDMNHYRFRCTLSNAWASDTSEPVELLVYVPAGVIAQPTAAEVVVGSPATFTVQAKGEPAPTFQWQLSTSGGRKWADIPGATSDTYETPATTFAMDGYLYRVHVTNEWGDEWSAPAALAVRNADTDAAVGQDGSYEVGTKTITWTWTVSNNGSETAQGLTLKTTLANGTKFSAIDLTGVTGGTATSKVGGRNITVKLPDLAPGESATVSVTALVTRATGTVANTVVLTSTSTDPDLSNNTASGSVDVVAGI